jgi:hypothetical protein
MLAFLALVPARGRRDAAACGARCEALDLLVSCSIDVAGVTIFQGANTRSGLEQRFCW